MPLSNLQELYEAMRCDDPRTCDSHGQWSSDLPTFGGMPPNNTLEVWSWDETHLIVGPCPTELQIVSREDNANEGAHHA